EVRVGDDDLAPGRAECEAILPLDVVAAPLVVTGDEDGLGASRGMRRRRPRVDRGRRARRPPPPAEPSAASALRIDRRERERMDLVDDRTTRFDGIVLLGLRPEVAEMIRRVVDAADECTLAVDDDD